MVTANLISEKICIANRATTGVENGKGRKLPLLP